MGHPYLERPLLSLSDCMLTGALTAPRYDSVPGDCHSDSDYESDSDFHDDIDYAYGLGEFAK